MPMRSILSLGVAGLYLLHSTGFADSAGKSSHSYSIEFDTPPTQQAPASSLPLADDDEFKVLLYNRGMALLLDPRDVIRQMDDIDQQMQQMDADGIGYYVCSRKAAPKTSQRSKKIYSTDLSSMQRDGYDCVRRNK